MYSFPLFPFFHIFSYWQLMFYSIDGDMWFLRLLHITPKCAPLHFSPFPQSCLKSFNLFKVSYTGFISVKMNMPFLLLTPSILP